MGMRRFRNLGLVFYPAKLKKKARGQDDRCGLNIKYPTRFSLAEIKRGTDDFSDTNVIGSGGYGKVYKAMLDDGHVVAIRRAEQGSMRWKARFTGEIELLSRFHHNNVLDVIGFCIENGERILVYDYIANGSLNDILLGKTEIQLDWRSRVQIALGSARALEYLHYDVNPRVIHRNIKSTNIFVNDCLTAKVAHFDVAQILPGGPNQVISAQIAGTQGYLDPEYLSTGQLSLKSDVYSFGVLLLELITARPASDMSGGVLVNEVKTCLETWGLSVLEEELMDPLLSTVSFLGFERFLSLALNCVQELGSQRPSMNDVVKELEGILAATETRGFSHSSPPAAGPSNYCSDIENDRGSSHSTPPAAGPSNYYSDIENDRGSSHSTPPAAGPSNYYSDIEIDRGSSYSTPRAAGPSNYYSDIEIDRGFSHSTPPAAGPYNYYSDIEIDRGSSHSTSPAAGPSNYYSDIEIDRGSSHSTPPAAGPSNYYSDIEIDRGSSHSTPPAAGPYNYYSDIEIEEGR